MEINNKAKCVLIKRQLYAPKRLLKFLPGLIEHQAGTACQFHYQLHDIEKATRQLRAPIELFCGAWA